MCIRDSNYCQSGSVNTSCFTTVNYKDLTAPAIQIHSDIDTVVACNKVEVESLLGSLVIDNCDEFVRQSFYVDYDETDGCFSNNGTPGVTAAAVVITATDACGNSNSTTRDFIIKRPTTFAVPRSLQLQCDDFGQTVPVLSLIHISEPTRPY